MEQQPLIQTPPVSPLSQTSQISSSDPSSNSPLKMMIILLIIIVVALLGVVGFLLMQTRSVQEKKRVVSPTVTVADSLKATENPMPQATTSAISPSAMSNVKTTIVNESSLPAQDVSELKARVINPYIDFNNDLGIETTEITVTKYVPNGSPSSLTYAYSLDYKMKNGGYGGFLISKTNDHIDWYQPECMGGCTFSEAFKSKYPEIVAAYKN